MPVISSSTTSLTCACCNQPFPTEIAFESYTGSGRLWGLHPPTEGNTNPVQYHRALRARGSFVYTGFSGNTHTLAGDDSIQEMYDYPRGFPAVWEDPEGSAQYVYRYNGGSDVLKYVDTREPLVEGSGQSSFVWSAMVFGIAPDETNVGGFDITDFAISTDPNNFNWSMLREVTFHDAMLAENDGTGTEGTLDFCFTTAFNSSSASSDYLEITGQSSILVLPVSGYSTGTSLRIRVNTGRRTYPGGTPAGTVTLDYYVTAPSNQFIFQADLGTPDVDFQHTYSSHSIDITTTETEDPYTDPFTGYYRL